VRGVTSILKKRDEGNREASDRDETQIGFGKRIFIRERNQGFPAKAPVKNTLRKGRETPGKK